MTELDLKQVKHAFGRAAEHYEAHAVLQREVESRLLERLELLQSPPQRILDVGCGTGHGTRLLDECYPQAHSIGLDFALPMLRQASTQTEKLEDFHWINADAGSLPLVNDSIDLLFCNLCLQWCENLPQVFHEFRRVMRPGGLLLISTFGPNTLHELQTAWAGIDTKPHVNHFPFMSDIGNCLLSAGFREPVLDKEKIILTYSELRTLLGELKAIGATNANKQRSRTLTGKKRFKDLSFAYEIFRIKDRLPATYEVIYAQAFAPDGGQPRRNQGGEIAHFPVEKLRGSRR